MDVVKLRYIIVKEVSMEKRNEEKQKNKGFFARMIEKLDKKLESKAKESTCCCRKDKDPSCCS